MKIIDKGTSPQSHMQYTINSDFAQKHLYYMTYSGTFYCNTNYKVERNNFYNFLFLYVKKGEMKFKYKGNTFIAKTNSFVFLDCNIPHYYESVSDDTIFDFLHFSGNSSKAYFHTLYKKFGCLYSLNNSHIIIEFLNRILLTAHNNSTDEHSTSLYIQHILYELYKVANTDTDTIENKVKQAILFIENHYSQNINLDDISNHVFLSPYYFTRIFKKKMDISPINYLINYRIKQAISFLHNSNLTIEEISYNCGFNHTSHFITTFKKQMGVSPKKFKDLYFN